jgi:hypothetical protein
MNRSDQLRAAGIIALVLLAAFLFIKKPISGSKQGALAPGMGQPASLSRTDTEGNAWTLDQTSPASLVSTEPNGPKAGPPILVKADVMRVGQEVSIGLILEGQSGEQYRPSVKKNGSTLSAPTLRIVNEAGQVIAQDSFQYG